MQAKESSSIVLVYPYTGYDIGIGISPPHSLLSIAAYLQSRDVQNRIIVIDQRVDKNWQQMLDDELKCRPLFVGISSMTGVQLRHALDVASFVRQKSQKTTIVFGGVHVSLLPEQSLRSDYMDICVTGEGEETVVDLVSALNEDDPSRLQGIEGIGYRNADGIKINKKRKPINMDSLPLDRFSHVDVERYIFSKHSFFSDRELDIGETSRGCCYDCAYCYNTVFHGRRWHAMSSERAIEMIKHNVQKYSLKSLWIRDDNFFVSISRAAEIISYIAQSGLKLYLPGITVQEFRRLPGEVRKDLQRIGGTMLRFGVESGSDRILSFINKGITTEDIFSVNQECRKFSIVPSYNLMIGFPRETREDVLATVEIMKRLKRENPSAQLQAVNLFTPYPGTRLFDIYQEDFPDDLPLNIDEWSTYHHLNLKKGSVSRRERRFYENIVEISYLISDVWFEALSRKLRFLFWPFRRWFKFRWDINAFDFAPEVLLLRKLKNILLRIE